MTTSLEEVLVEGDLWKKGIGSPVPDIPKMVTVLGGSQTAKEDVIPVPDQIGRR